MTAESRLWFTPVHTQFSWLLGVHCFLVTRRKLTSIEYIFVISSRHNLYLARSVFILVGSCEIYYCNKIELYRLKYIWGLTVDKLLMLSLSESIHLIWAPFDSTSLSLSLQSLSTIYLFKVENVIYYAYPFSFLIFSTRVSSFAWLILEAGGSSPIYFSCKSWGLGNAI